MISCEICDFMMICHTLLTYTSVNKFNNNVKQDNDYNQTDHDQKRYHKISLAKNIFRAKEAEDFLTMRLYGSRVFEMFTSFYCMVTLTSTACSY